MSCAARRAARRADGRGRARAATPRTATASPTRPRCSSRSRCCAATAAATARSPSRRPASSRPYLDARRGARDRPPRARRSAATRRCSPSARRPRTRYPQAAEWLAAHGYASTVDYLVAACRRGARRDRAAPPRQRRRAHRGRARRGCARCQPVAGDDDRDARRPARRARRPALRRARQDRRSAASPRSKPRAGRGCRSPPASSSASARPAPSASTRSSRSRTRTPRHGHVQEVIVQNFLPKPGTAMHNAPRRARPTSSSGRSPSARLVLAADDAPAGAAEPRATTSRRCSRPASTTGAASRRSPLDHVNPERPVARARAAARRDRGRRAHARAAPHRLPRVRARPRRVARPRRALRGARAPPTSKASRATTTWAPGGDDRAARTCSRAAARRAGPRVRARRSARCSTACSPARRSASTRSSRCSARAAPSSREVAAVADELRTRDRRRRRSRSSATATSTTRTSARSSAGSARSRRARSRSTCAATPYLLELEEMQRRVVEAVECGATEVCLQGGIHPDFDGDYYLDVARAVKEVAPQIHVHGFTALEVTEGARRLDMPLADYLVHAEGRRPRHAARHRGRDPRRRGAGDHLPRQGQHRGVARGAPHRALGRPALERHDHVRHGRAARCTSPATSCAPVRCRRRPAASPSSCRCRSCTWPRRSSCSSKARRGPDVPRGAADARGRPHRVPRLDRQHPGVVGEGRRRAAPARSCRPAPTTSAAR